MWLHLNFLVSSSQLYFYVYDAFSNVGIHVDHLRIISQINKEDISLNLMCHHIAPPVGTGTVPHTLVNITLLSFYLVYWSDLEINDRTAAGWQFNWMLKIAIANKLTCTSLLYALPSGYALLHERNQCCLSEGNPADVLYPVELQQLFSLLIILPITFSNNQFKVWF